MSEITRVEDPPMIRFGKHAGKSAAEVMATDPKYVQWMLAQPWFQEKNPQLVQFFVSGGRSEAAETPEHNALQAKFTQDAYCLAAAAMFSAGQRLRTAAVVQQEAIALAGPAMGGRIAGSNPTISQRTFEVNAWDVQFSYSGASSKIDTRGEPECSCTPLPLPDLPDEPEAPHSVGGAEPTSEALQEYHRLRREYDQARDGHAKISAMNQNRKKSRHGPGWTPEGWTDKGRWYAEAFANYNSATKHEAECPRSSTVYFKAWCLEDDYVIWCNPVRFGLELKPSMGDDFPAVLRQVIGYRLRSNGIHAAVVVGEFHSAAVPWNIVKQQFWESGVLLIREAELDTLVENHAVEWGASIDDQAVDFTVEFKDQL